MNDDGLRQLLHAVANDRDRDAFATLFRHVAPRLKGFALQIGYPDDEAEELMRGTMVDVWRRAGSFDPDRTSISAWLFTLVRDTRQEGFHREKPRFAVGSEPMDQPVDMPRSVVNARCRPAGETLSRELRDLPREHSEPLRKAFLEGKSHAAVAEELEIPLNVVRARLRLALARLQTDRTASA